VSGLRPDDGRHLGDDGTELGLGVLTGRERARAVEHLQQCGRCRDRVHRMAFTSDELLRLVPGQQPPAGFSAQVTERLRQARKPPGRSRRSKALATVAAAVLVGSAGLAGLAGWGLRTGAEPSGPAGASGSARSAGSAGSAGAAALSTAALFTPAHQAIGKVYLHSGSHTWMFTTVDLTSGATTVICQLTDRTGRVITVGSFRVTGGDGYWGSPEPDQPSAITSARLITTGGAVLATATFGTSGG
jgi:predicted anti-sigma-YlaC factor YlaD